MIDREIRFTDGTRLQLHRNRRGVLEELRGYGLGPLWLHEHRKCVNGARCECGCGSTKVRVVKKQRAAAMSACAKAHNAWRSRWRMRAPGVVELVHI
jgi:hypothetical protein